MAAQMVSTCFSTGIGHVLGLLEDFHQPLAAVELGLGGLVQVGTELGEGRQLAVLGQVQLDRPGHRLHGLHLGGAADAAHRDADVHGRADARVEQVGFQEDLAVGDGDDVGGDVGGHVAGLGLDHRQGGQGAAAPGLGQLGGALQQAAVQVEHVAGVGLAPGRAAQQQGDLAVGHGLLGKVVVDDEHVLARVAGAAGLPSTPCHMKYSPMAAPVMGARNSSGAGSEAVAATTMVCFMAS